MAFIAEYENNFNTWDYILGDFYKNLSIAVDRFYYLQEINYENPVILGADCLGERKKKAEDVGSEAARNLITEIDSGASADKYLADQLMPFLAISGGKIRASEITNHSRTNIWITEKFIGNKFRVNDDKKEIVS